MSILHHLSQMFQLGVSELKDTNANNKQETSQQEGGRIIWCHVTTCSQKDAAALYKNVKDNYGHVDVLILSQDEETSSSDATANAFLNNLNTQLMTQFWLVMAFLPGMMERNQGQIISIGLGRTSSLTNTGIMRSVYEEFLENDTKVKLTLVERNAITEKYLPRLSTSLLVRMLLKSAMQTTTSQILVVPSLGRYFLVLPNVIVRLLVKPLAQILQISSRQIQRDPAR